MLGYKSMHRIPDSINKSFRVTLVIRKKRLQCRIINKLIDSEFLRITIDKACDVYHHIGKNPYVALLTLNNNVRNSSILNPVGKFRRSNSSCFGKDFSGIRIYNILGNGLVLNTVAKFEFLIEFVTSYFCKIVSSRIEEHCIDKALCTFNSQRLAGTNLLV